MRLGFFRSPLVVASLSLSLVGGACGSKADPSAAPEGTSIPAAKTDLGSQDEAVSVAKVDAKPKEATGVAFQLTVGGVESSLKLSRADIAARGEGSPMAAFGCMGMTGSVTVTDFTVGDDASKKGEVFSAGVTKTGIGATRAGKAEEVRINHRRAGEDTQTIVIGNATWAEGLMSGSAEGTGEDGVAVKLTWTCEAAE